VKLALKGLFLGGALKISVRLIGLEILDTRDKFSKIYSIAKNNFNERK
jgi:hypothetical protein